jgi:hypothetical protein
MKPEPTDKLDTTTTVVVNGPKDGPRNTGWIVGLTPPDLEGLLEADAEKLARPVPRGARPSNGPGLPAESAAGPWAILTSLTR